VIHTRSIDLVEISRLPAHRLGYSYETTAPVDVLVPTYRQLFDRALSNGTMTALCWGRDHNFRTIEGSRCREAVVWVLSYQLLERSVAGDGTSSWIGAHQTEKGVCCSWIVPRSFIILTFLASVSYS
jgi:hypothetical protein